MEMLAALSINESIQMPKIQLIRELYETIDGFIKDNTEAEVAIQVLTACYSNSEPDLTTLLNEYHESRAIVYPLTLHPHTKIFTPIFIHLIDLNDNILNMPLHKHGLPNETLIEHFLARKEKYTEIITWLRRNKPSLRRIEIQQAEEQDTNTLFSFLCAAPTNLATVKPVCAQALQTADNALRQTSTTNQRLTTIPKARGVLTHGNPDDLYKTSIINQMTLLS